MGNAIGAPPSPDDREGEEKGDGAETPVDPKKLTGAVERTIADQVPDFDGVTRSVAVQMQDCYEIFQKVEKSYRITLYLGLAFLALALISWFTNRSTRTQMRSNLSDAK